MAKKGSNIHLPDRIAIDVLEDAISRMNNYESCVEDDGEVTESDLDKATFLLKAYNKLLTLLKDYEMGQKFMFDGLTAHESMDAYGKGRYEHGTETHGDSTANTVVLKDKRQIFIGVYKVITDTTKALITNIADPVNHLIAKRLYLDGEKYSDCKFYMQRGYAKNIPPVKGTTFAVRRRQALEAITRALKFIGLLDLVVIRVGYRTKKKELGLQVVEWNV